MDFHFNRESDDYKVTLSVYPNTPNKHTLWTLKLYRRHPKGHFHTVAFQVRHWTESETRAQAVHDFWCYADNITCDMGNFTHELQAQYWDLCYRVINQAESVIWGTYIEPDE